MQGSCLREGGERDSALDWVPQAWLSHPPGSPTSEVRGFSYRQWGGSWRASLCSVLCRPHEHHLA